MRKVVTVAAIVLIPASLALMSNADEAEKTDTELTADMKLLQGTWELHHGNEGKGRPTIRSIKSIEGNKETLRRYNSKTGRKTHEHSVEFKLSRSGSVRVMTFYRVGGDPDSGLSYVYRVDEQNFWDIPGLLRGGEFRNYQDKPTIWHWKRVKEPIPDAKTAQLD